jgi:glycosyltransferase involved in cell wall biosynthesis
MRLGVVPLLSGDSGGVYQYCLMVLEGLRAPGVLASDDRVTLFVHDVQDPLLKQVAAPEWEIRPLSPPSLRRKAVALARAFPGGEQLLGAMRTLAPQESRVPDDISRIRKKPKLSAWFRKANIDVMLYPVPMSIAFETDVPYIFAVHDLQHRLQPQFPEVGSPKEWTSREYLFRNGVAKALLVIADSETGCEDVMACYGETGITEDRVMPLPFVPPSYVPQNLSSDVRLAVRRRYGLPERYVFYPAQFWPHKNHLRLIEAMALLRDRDGLALHLVLCGSHYNEIRSKTFAEVFALVSKLGLEQNVHYLGFVPDGDMAALYAEAEALVMPTFFGPTNIPILEAWTLDCPVLTSDLRGIRDQAGDAALLCDPHSIEALAQGLSRLWTDQDLRTLLSALGRERVNAWTKSHFAKRLSSLLDCARAHLPIKP